MSQVPVTPPEMRSREDTPPDSLLERLRKITGLTEAQLPPPPLEKPVHRDPPVELLMVALREVTGVAAACGIAVVVSLASLAVCLTCCVKSAALDAARRLERRRQPRQAARETPPPPALAEPASAKAEAMLPNKAEIPPPIALPPEQALVQDEAVEEVAVPEVISPANIAAERSSVAAPPRRRWRRMPAVSGALVCVLPALLLIPAIRYQITSLLGWGNARVVAGEGGWLFPRASASEASGIYEIAARLRAGGATLIVVSVPAKAAIFPEWLDASHSGGLKRDPAVAAAQRKLSADGALLFDLGPVLYALKTGGAGGEALFRAQSSHWSPGGVERAAAAVASFVQQQPGYAALPLHPIQPLLIRHTLTDPREDLAAAFDSRRWREAHPPEPLHFIRLLDAGRQPLAPDPASPVVLIGGDEIRIYDDPTLTPASDHPPSGGRFSAGFAQYLAVYLSASIDVHTADSSAEAAVEWLESRPAADRARKKFILWAVPDREGGH